MDVGAERLITSWVAEACTRLAFTLNSSHVANSAKEYLPILRQSRRRAGKRRRPLRG